MSLVNVYVDAYLGSQILVHTAVKLPYKNLTKVDGQSVISALEWRVGKLSCMQGHIFATPSDVDVEEAPVNISTQFFHSSAVNFP